LHALTGLMGSQVRNGRGHGRSGRRGVSRSATTGRKQENAKEKMENERILCWALSDVKSRPGSIFHFHNSRITGCSG
jgi:hypothetical protein